jgi:hypothetical protein
MLTMNVVLEWNALLLECLSRNVANIAIIFLIVDQFVVLLSQGSEGVEHDTIYDIAEKNSKEDAVDHIIWKAHNLELLHGLAYRTRDE